MTDYVNQWLSEHKATDPTKGLFYKTVVPHITCKDGTTLSVQASGAHYCNPKSDSGPWSSVEVWCIRKGKRTIYPRSFGAGGKHDPYGWVPVEIVNNFIKRHGGLA